MATIVEVDFNLDPRELVGGIEGDLSVPDERSPGWHQSDIIRDLENVIIKPGQRLPDVDMTDDERNTMLLYRELGFAWEVILETVFKRRRIDGLDSRKFLKQPENCKDGIYQTSDAVYLGGKRDPRRVLEYKLTFRSMARASLDRFESEFWSWMVQLKGNCYGWDTRLASIFMFFVCGDYRPQVPRTKRYDIAFTDEELQDNWSMLLAHRKVMIKEGRVPACVK